MKYFTLIFAMFFFFSSSSSFVMEISTFGSKELKSCTLIRDSFTRVPGVISLDQSKFNEQSSGALIFNEPFFVSPLLRFNFETEFVFMISKTSDIQSQGDGFSFFLSPDPFNSAGLYLPYGVPSPSVAVVFDTSVYNNSADNGIRILQTGVYAVAYNPVDFKLNDGTLLKAWIEYGMDFDFQNSISIYVSSNLLKKPSQPILTKNLDIHVEFQNQNLFFGYSAYSPITSLETHSIYNWYLEVNVTKSKKKTEVSFKFMSPTFIAVIIVGSLTFIAATVTGVFFILRTDEDGLNMVDRWRRRTYDRLRRARSLRRFFPDAPAESMGENVGENVDSAARTSSVQGQNVGSSEDRSSHRRGSVEVDQPQTIEMVPSEESMRAERRRIAEARKFAEERREGSGSSPAP